MYFKFSCKFFLCVTMMLVVAASLPSCSKDKNSDDENQPASATITIGGVSQQFAGDKDSSVALTGKVRSMNTGYLTITLNDKNSDKTIEIYIVGYDVQAGDYDLAIGLGDNNLSIGSLHLHGENSAENEVYGTYWETDDDQILRGQGTLHINSVAGNRISGTFQMQLLNYDYNTGQTKELTVTDGKINMPLFTIDIDYT